MSVPRVDELLVGFTAALRHGGLPVTPDRTQAFLQAVSLTGAHRRESVYWSGRATLCASPDDHELYDAAFVTWFETAAPEPPPARSRQSAPDQAQASLTEDTGIGATVGEEALTAQASQTEVLRHRDIAKLSERERTELAQLFARLTVRPPRRRSLRHAASHRGGLDMRRTLRAQLRVGGEVTALQYRRRTSRPRRIVLLVDVSGSMQPYADALLRLGHRMVTALPRHVEVFTLGTRLTRITPALRLRQPDEAIAAAGQIVPDWSGGTRLGEVVEAFVRRWARRGPGRGAIVVIASDGWERGDPALLGDQLRQLRLLAHALIWMNPHRGKPGYAPIQSGIQASLPYLDRLLAGHTMAAFAELLEVIADA